MSGERAIQYNIRQRGEQRHCSCTAGQCTVVGGCSERQILSPRPWYIRLRVHVHCIRVEREVGRVDDPEVYCWSLGTHLSEVICAALVPSKQLIQVASADAILQSNRISHWTTFSKTDLCALCGR